MQTQIEPRLLTPLRSTRFYIQSEKHKFQANEEFYITDSIKPGNWYCVEGATPRLVVHVEVRPLGGIWADVIIPSIEGKGKCDPNLELTLLEGWHFICKGQVNREDPKNHKEFDGRITEEALKLFSSPHNIKWFAETPRIWDKLPHIQVFGPDDAYITQVDEQLRCIEYAVPELRKSKKPNEDPY